MIQTQTVALSFRRYRPSNSLFAQKNDVFASIYKRKNYFLLFEVGAPFTVHLRIFVLFFFCFIVLFCLEAGVGATALVRSGHKEGSLPPTSYQHTPSDGPVCVCVCQCSTVVNGQEGGCRGDRLQLRFIDSLTPKASFL